MLASCPFQGHLKSFLSQALASCDFFRARLRVTDVTADGFGKQEEDGGDDDEQEVLTSG